MDIIPGECLARSVGAGNQLISVLIQTLLQSFCTLSDPSIWPEDYGPIALQRPQSLEYDFIVIGAGTAGSVVASRLCESPGCEVLLLEAGCDPPVESQIPLMFMHLPNTKYGWHYLTKSNGKSCLSSKISGVCACHAGKMIGGTGALNAMVHLRGNPRDYNKWKKAKITNWGWDDVSPYFDRSVKNGESDPCLPNQGYLPVGRFPKSHPFVKVVRQAAAELGHAILQDFKDFYVGYALANATQENGQRSSSGKVFLEVAKERRNFHLIKHALATKINFDPNKRARSVNFIYEDQYEMRATARKEIIVSAGAIESSKLLLLSGIGPKDHLEAMKIPVIVDLPVGANFQDHPVVIFCVLFPNERETNPLNTFDNTYQYVAHNEGTFSYFEVTDLIGTASLLDPKSSFPDVQFYHWYLEKNSKCVKLIMELFSYSNSVLKSVLEANKQFDIYITLNVLLRPKSLGNIKLSSSFYKDPPVIYPNVLDKEEDIELLVRALQYQLEFLNTETFKKRGATPLKIKLPACEKYGFLSKEYLGCYTRQMTSTVFHFSSSVKMGPRQDKTSVVDPTLQVNGVEGLRVVDASIMPNIIGETTQAATIMIGERGADFVRNAWNC